MKNFSAGGIEWEPAEPMRPCMKWKGTYSGVEVYLYHRGWLWTAKVRNKRGWSECGRWYENGYKTRREAIEGIKCIVLFMSGIGVTQMAYGVYGQSNTTMIHKVEAHLREWL